VGIRTISEETYMGIAFITAKAEAFKHLRDKEFESQIKSETLFSDLAESVETTYRCRSDGGSMIPPIGTMVLLYDANSAIGVFHLNKQIGVMIASDAAELLQLMKQAQTEMFSGQIVKTHVMSKTFLVQLKRSSH
jgi:hypothetical protein